MKYQMQAKQQRIARAKAMLKLAKSGMTLDEIAQKQTPPISRQRVFSLIQSIK